MNSTQDGVAKPQGLDNTLNPEVRLEPRQIESPCATEVAPPVDGSRLLFDRKHSESLCLKGHSQMFLSGIHCIRHV